MKAFTFLFLVISIFSGCNQKAIKYTVIQEGDKDGMIQESGYITIKPIYKHILKCDGNNAKFDHPNLVNLHWIHNEKSGAYSIVQNIDGKFGIIDLDGNLLLKVVYDSITYFFDGFARIEVGGKFGLIDTNFNIVLKPTYDYIQEFVGDIALVHHNNRYGCINKNIELKIKPTYDRIYFQQENFLRTLIDKKWGYLDNQCNVLSKPIYDYGYDFSNGFAKVILDEKVGYLNPQGKLISKPIFTRNSGHF
ncbi:MAG: WG repeat-containing protein [Arcobacteraceae bacterium]|nr:WG repeat-containing protein [Arcobacteraceae bacterium]